MAIEKSQSVTAYDTMMQKLVDGQTRIGNLQKQQRELDAQIEDQMRVNMAIERFVYALQPAVLPAQVKGDGKVVNFKLDEAELERAINEAV